MSDHPTPEELEGFVWNRASSVVTRAVVSHLASGCERCRKMVAAHLEGLLGLSEPPSRDLSSKEDLDYDSALDRAFSHAFKMVGDPRETRKREALALMADAGLESLPEVPEHLRGVPLFEAYLERSWVLRHEDPREMVRLAEQARALAEDLDPVEVGAQAVLDLRCRAWVELGNAYRVADDLTDAESALGEAMELFFKGSRDELLAARLFDVQASLYGARRRFDLAESALDMVFAIYKRRGDEHLAGRALISKGTYLGYQGEAEAAVQLLQQGVELIDAHHDPRLIFLGLHNQARFLMDCGRLREARITLFKLKARGLGPDGRVNELKVRWLEGQINAGLGELERAEQALLEVKRGFDEIGLGYKAALAGLELGAVMLRQAHHDAAAREVLEAVDVFIALGIGRETGASLLLLKESFQKRLADAALLDYIIGLLRRGEGASDERGLPAGE